MKKISIAIDGFSSTGKSTLARQLAKALNYIYIDTGAMYRAVALYALQNGLLAQDGVKAEELLKRLPEVEVDFAFDPATQRNLTRLNGKVVEGAIRSMEISNLVTRVSSLPQVRDEMVKRQQALAQKGGVVMDGRDIGSVVMPHAELKIFMTAEPEIRAQRRFDEMKAKGQESSMEDVLNNLEQRDHADTHRHKGPLIRTDDAYELDNSYLTEEEQFEMALRWAKEKLG